MNSKTVHLVGGVPAFDLTVMDFDRWGMHGAAPRLRQVMHDGMNIMDRCEIYAKPVPGREHHKHWFQDVDHPDMRLMAAAPMLLRALLLIDPTGQFVDWQADDATPIGAAIADAISQATGGTLPPTETPKATKHECSRSHPHELMDGYCELRTEIARLTNENTRLKARPERTGLSNREINSWWHKDNGLEDVDMCSLEDFRAVIRTVEAKHNIPSPVGVEL